VGVRDRELVDDDAAVLERDLDAGAERPPVRVGVVVPLRPGGILERPHLLPEADRLRACGALRRVGVEVVPRTVLEGDGEDVRRAVVERLTARAGVVLLRVPRPRSDDDLGVVARRDHALADRLGMQIALAGPLAYREGEVDERLPLS
jgi:hypothetical protein